MNELIRIAGQEIPRTDWDATPASVKAVVTVLSEEHAHISEQLTQTSKNSSRPPSSDTLGKSAVKAEQRPSQSRLTAKGKKRGKPSSKKKAKGFGFYEVAPHEVHHHIPEICRHCGEELSGSDEQPHRHQVIDIPPLPLEIEEHQLHRLSCECCGKTTRGELPSGVPSGRYGDGLVGLVGLLSSGEHRQSHSMVQSLLSEVFNLELSRSSINRMRTQVSEAVSVPVAAAHHYVQSQPSVHSDETSFAQRNRDGANPEKRKGWLWTLCSPLVQVFRVSLSRSQATAKTMIGEAFNGIVHSDRCSAYGWLAVKHRQVC